MKRTRIVLLLLALIGAGVVVTLWLRRSRAPAAPPTANGLAVASTRLRAKFEVVEMVFDAGLKGSWIDWGWGPREIPKKGPARAKFSNFGVVVLRREEPLAGAGAFSFRFHTPEDYGAFLDVSLGTEQADDSAFPRVALERRYLAEIEEGWFEALIPIEVLNPTRAPFDRVTIKANRSVPDEWVALDKVLFTKAGPDNGWVGPVAARKARLKVRCDRPKQPISPMIYGISQGIGTTGETAHRVGGNPMSRLNWELGFWNTASDWYFENVGDTSKGLWNWIDEAHAQQLKLAVVVPMLGWVAKDNVSSGFPKATFGVQRAHDPGRAEAGDGHKPDGKEIAPGAPTLTSVAAPPALIRQWLETLREKDRARGARGVHQYILDNEPSLWHVTHRDVHPEPLSYDELLDRTQRYASVIREVDPEAQIAGPAAWGWTEYFYSAKDMSNRFGLHLDRRAHGDAPLLAWYLKQLADYERRTGKRLLDVVDVHFYPQAAGVYARPSKTDAATSALRLRSTRAFWDPTYRDESWINEPVRLIPRLKEWIAENYPGRGISIGEWSFGAEDHPSGALAIAETLGRFGQQGVSSAFYWSKIQEGSPAFQAFRAFRNFDGRGGRFFDTALATEETLNVSLFASRDEATGRVVAIVLNLDPDVSVDAEVDVATCGAVRAQRTYGYRASGKTLEQLPAKALAKGPLSELLPPWSITVLDLTL